MLEIWHNGVDIVLKSSLNLYYGGDLFLLTFSLSLNAMKFQKCFVKSHEYETMYYLNLEQIRPNCSSADFFPILFIA